MEKCPPEQTLAFHCRLPLPDARPPGAGVGAQCGRNVCRAPLDPRPPVNTEGEEFSHRFRGRPAPERFAISVPERGPRRFSQCGPLPSSSGPT